MLVKNYKHQNRLYVYNEASDSLSKRQSAYEITSLVYMIRDMQKNVGQNFRVSITELFIFLHTAYEIPGRNSRLFIRIKVRY